MRDPAFDEKVLSDLDNHFLSVAVANTPTVLVNGEQARDTHHLAHVSCEASPWRVHASLCARHTAPHYT